MASINKSPMASSGEASPMANSFTGYGADRNHPIQSSFSMLTDNPNTAAPEPDDGVPSQPQTSSSSVTGQVDPDDLDQMADVTYEIDEKGNIVPDSISLPEPKDDAAKPAPKKAAKKPNRRKPTK